MSIASKSAFRLDLHPAGLEPATLLRCYETLTFGGTLALGMVENMIGLVEDADVIDDGNYCFITTPLVKSKWKTIPAAVNYPEYLWMGSLENQTVALGAARGCVSTLPNTNGLDLVTDPFSLGDYGQLRVVCTRLLRSYNPGD